MNDRYEYKVWTQKDKLFSGKVDPDAVEAALNAHAADGWRVCSTSTIKTSSDRSEVMVILERQLR